MKENCSNCIHQNVCKWCACMVAAQIQVNVLPNTVVIDGPISTIITVKCDDFKIKNNQIQTYKAYKGGGTNGKL